MQIILMQGLQGQNLIAVLKLVMHNITRDRTRHLEAHNNQHRNTRTSRILSEQNTSTWNFRLLIAVIIPNFFWNKLDFTPPLKRLPSILNFIFKSSFIYLLNWSFICAVLTLPLFYEQIVSFTQTWGILGKGIKLPFQIQFRTRLI